MFRLIVLFCLTTVGVKALAADDKSNEQPAHVRIFGGTSWINPSQVNSAIKAGGINEIGDAGMYGVEGTYGKGILNYGARVQGMFTRRKETAAVSANPIDPYYSSFERLDILGVARINLINTSSFKFDTVGGVGLSTLRLDVRTSGGEGTYEKPNSDGTLATFAGASVGVGFSNIYLFVEAGQQWNKAGGLKTSGTTSSSLKEIDSSGPYVLVGIDCSHIPGLSFGKK